MMYVYWSINVESAQAVTLGSDPEEPSGWMRIRYSTHGVLRIANGKYADSI